MYEQEHIDIQTDEQEDIDTDLDEEKYLTTITEDAEELTDLQNNSLSEVVSTLCSVCLRLFQSRFPQDEICSHHPSLSSLKESVDAGCRFCEILARKLGDRCKRTPREWSIKCAVTPMSDVKTLGFFFTFERCDASNTSRRQSQVVIPFYLYPACKLGLGPEFSGASRSQT